MGVASRRRGRVARVRATPRSAARACATTTSPASWACSCSTASTSGAAADSARAARADAGRQRFCREFGIDVDALARQRRPLCRACLDWSVRRYHLAGALGAAVLNRCLELGWARRASASRVVRFTRLASVRFVSASPGETSRAKSAESCPYEASSVAHQLCRSKNRAVLSQSAERLDRALRVRPVRVKSNGHTRTSCSAHQCDASQQKGERIAWKLGVSRDGILHHADPRLRTDGGTDQSGAQHEIVNVACGYRVLGRKLQFAPPSLRPGGASAPIRSAVTHRNP